MRLALIPLFLTHPKYAAYVSEALNRLPPAQQNLLRCYYTAAQLLQQKYQTQLTNLFGACPPLPALFETDLKLDGTEPADIRLQRLAKLQAQISGRPINWYGTYEHAYTRFTRHTRRRMQWQ
ncbi:MAG: hypothetical protein GY803_28620 [Chloroflexi bacterium]|nr:hypothetical protein [Chloroflexota bacterium]